MASCSCYIGCSCKTINGASNQAYQREYWYEQTKTSAHTGTIPYGGKDF